MRAIRPIVTVLAIAAIVGVALIARPAAQSPVRVVVQTELGDIVLEVDTKRAPTTAANFLRYLDAGHYDGGTFHRTVKMGNQPDSPTAPPRAGLSASTISPPSTMTAPAIPMVRDSRPLGASCKGWMSCGRFSTLPTRTHSV